MSIPQLFDRLPLPCLLAFAARTPGSERWVCPRLTCRNVAASLPLESRDNEGLYKERP